MPPYANWGWMYVWLDGWMDGPTDGWTDGWMGGWVGGWMDGMMDGFCILSQAVQVKLSPLFYIFTQLLLVYLS